MIIAAVIYVEMKKPVGEYSSHYPVFSGITVNLGKRLFSGVYRSVNTWRMPFLPEQVFLYFL